MKAEALRCRNVAGMLFNFIGNTVIHSCVKVELSYEIKDVYKRQGQKKPVYLPDICSSCFMIIFLTISPPMLPALSLIHI